MLCHVLGIRVPLCVTSFVKSDNPCSLSYLGEQQELCELLSLVERKLREFYHV